MKKCLLLVLSISFLFENLLAENFNNSADSWKLGVEWVQEIQEKYQSKKYSDFLSSIDEKYKAREEGESIFPALCDALLLQKNEKNDALYKELQNLRTKTDRKLVRIGRKHPKETISKMIHSAIEEREENIDEALLLIQMLQDEKDPLTSEAKKIFEEYIYKTSLLSQEFSSENFGDFREKETALHLEKWEKLIAIAENQSGALGDYIRKQSAMFSQKRSASHDIDFLYGLSLKMIEAKSDAEKRASEVMEDYLSKKMEIVKKFAQ